MKSLSDFGSQELNPKQMREVNGGFIFLYLIYTALTDNDQDEEGTGGGSFGGGGASGSW